MTILLKGGDFVGKVGRRRQGGVGADCVVGDFGGGVIGAVVGTAVDTAVEAFTVGTLAGTAVGVAVVASHHHNQNKQTVTAPRCVYNCIYY